MEKASKLSDLLIKTSDEIVRAIYDKDGRVPKLTGWCGEEAYMLLRRDVPVYHLGFVPNGSADPEILFARIAYKCDPGQDLHTITICLDGAPIRQVNTKTMNVEQVMGPLGVSSADLEALASMFKHHDRYVVGRAGVMTAKLDLRLSSPANPEEPIKLKTRSFSFHEWKEKGLVYSPEKNVWAITLAGKNAIQQWRAF